MKNAVEYVLGSNPLVPDTTPVGVTAVDDTHLVYRFPRADASESPDVFVTVEAGSGLTAWPGSFRIGADTALSSPGVSIAENGDAPDTVSVSVPRDGGSAKFVRLKVVVTP